MFRFSCFTEQPVADTGMDVDYGSRASTGIPYFRTASGKEPPRPVGTVWQIRPLHAANHNAL